MHDVRVWPRIGDVWEAPISGEVYLVTEIKQGFAWAALLTDGAKIRRFHPMDSPIGMSWTRVVSGKKEDE